MCVSYSSRLNALLDPKKWQTAFSVDIVCLRRFIVTQEVEIINWRERPKEILTFLRKN